jgi:hypothetical protein
VVRPKQADYGADIRLSLLLQACLEPWQMNPKSLSACQKSMLIVIKSQGTRCDLSSHPIVWKHILSKPQSPGLYQMLKLDLSQHKLKAAVNVGETCGSHLGIRPIGRTQRLSPPIFWSLSSVGPFLAWNTDRERYHPERVEPKLK